jgi:hypothetical protein
MHCCIFLGFLCELYYDARIHEHHVLTEAFFLQSLHANAATRVISGFCGGVNEFIALSGCYASQTGS